MFQFHSVPLLSHLRQPPYRAMSTSPPSPGSPTSSHNIPIDHNHNHHDHDQLLQPFRFLDLPLELREQIYSLYFRPADRLVKSEKLEAQGFYGGVYEFETSVYGACRQVQREARRVWRREVRTVKIGTPWPSAGMYLYMSYGDGGGE